MGSFVPFVLFQIAGFDTYNFAVAHDDQFAVFFPGFLYKAFAGQQNARIDFLLHLFDFDLIHSPQSLCRITYLLYGLLPLFRLMQ